MRTAFACILYRSSEVDTEALSQGFAVALAGYDLDRPRLLTAELRGLPGWSVAFYQSRASGPAHDEIEHARELFEDELPPALSVRDTAEMRTGVDPTLYALVYDEARWTDDTWRFDGEGYERRYVHDGEDGLEAGRETAEESDVESIALDVADDADDVTERAAIEQATRAHRGSAWLSSVMGVAIVPALVGALYEADHAIAVNLVDPSPKGVEAATRALNKTLRRTDGRGAFVPQAVAGTPAPPAYVAMVGRYDWSDPADPGDLFRGLSIGVIEGTLRFLRPEDRKNPENAANHNTLLKNVYPIARISTSTLGSQATGRASTLALDADGAHLHLIDDRGHARPAGPTLGELLIYLALGFRSRNEIEENLIVALMLRAKLRADAAS